MDESLEELKKLENVTGKPVLLQANFNLQKIDSKQILALMPSIKILKQKGAKILIAANFAKQENEITNEAMEQICRRFAEILRENIVYLSQYKGEAINERIKSMNNGQVGILKNVNARMTKV